MEERAFRESVVDNLEEIAARLDELNGILAKLVKIYEEKASLG